MKLGFLVRNGDHADAGGGSDRAARRKRELKRGQREAREEMYEDLGIH